MDGSHVYDPKDCDAMGDQDENRIDQVEFGFLHRFQQYFLSSRASKGPVLYRRDSRCAGGRQAKEQGPDLAGLTAPETLFWRAWSRGQDRGLFRFSSRTWPPVLGRAFIAPASDHWNGKFVLDFESDNE